MSRSRILALLVLGPLALALVAIVAHEPLQRWFEREPVMVLTGEVGTPHTAGGPIVTVHGAAFAAPGSDAMEYADVPEGAQLVVVDLTIDDAAEGPLACPFQLEATVGGEHGRWAWDAGATDVTSCYSEDGPISGVVAFVLPAGDVEGARLLVGGETFWLGVPVELAAS